MGFRGCVFAPGFGVLGLEEKEKPLIAILGAVADSSLESDMTWVSERAGVRLWFGFYYML